MNLLGCLVAGLLAGGIARHGRFTADIRAMLIVGVMGGFTTCSASGLEPLALLRRGDIAMAVVCIAARGLCALLLAAAGGWIATRGSASTGLLPFFQRRASETEPPLQGRLSGRRF